MMSLRRSIWKNSLLRHSSSGTKVSINSEKEATLLLNALCQAA
jgi:hypothetical protein